MRGFGVGMTWESGHRLESLFSSQRQDLKRGGNRCLLAATLEIKPRNDLRHATRLLLAFDFHRDFLD